MVQRKMNTEHGFTIVEVLVAISIVTIILGIVSSVFIFVQGQAIRWERSINLDSEKELVTQRLYLDIQNAQSINRNDSILVFVNNQNKEFIYRMNGPVLTRNKLSLIQAHDSISIGRINVSDTLITLNIMFFQNQNIWETEINHSVRKPKNWELLK